VQKKHPVRSLISTVLLLLVIWSIFLFSKLLNEEKDYQLETFVPKEALFTLSLNSRAILKQTLRDLISEEGEASFQQIAATLKRRNSEEKNNRLGLDLQSKIVLFSVPLKSDHHICLLTGISNHSLLEKESKQLEEQGIGIATKDDVALLIFPVKGGKLKNEDLSIQASRILEGKRNTGAPNISNSALHLSINSATQNVYPFMLPGEFDIELKEHKIRMKGEFSWDEDAVNETIQLMKPRGLHISIPKFSDEIKDSVQAILSPLGLSSTDLTGCSMNYRGLLIEEVPGLKILPDMDGLFHFKRAMDIDSVFAIMKSNNDLFIKTDDGFKYGSRQYFLELVSPNTIYLGQSKFRSALIREADSDLIFECSGDLKALTQIDGNGMMRKLVELLSMYSASKGLLNKVEDFDFTAMRQNDGKAEIRGILLFKSDESASLALLNFLFDAKYIR
jgi:hypothetical protein